MDSVKFRFEGARVVLTGAASGMGEHLAHQLAARGSNLTLLDKDGARLNAVATAIERDHPGRIRTTHAVDLAMDDEVSAFVDTLPEGGRRIDLLINNAGVALGGRFTDLTAAEFDWVMAINFRAPVTLVRGVLPLMGRGAHIVNMSSLFGLVAPAGQSGYAASKFALRGFSEALRRELAPSAITVTTVHPGGVRTRIAESARIAAIATPAEAAAGRAAFARMLSFPADRAAAQIVDAVEQRRARLVITTEAKVVDAAARLLPVTHLETVQRVQRTMRRLTHPRRAGRV